MKVLSISLMMLMIITSIWSIGLSGERYATDGLDYYQRGDYKNAIEMFKAANNAADNQKPEYLFWLGRLHIAVEDTSSARFWLNKYNATNDKAFAGQARDYLEILNRQTLIFEQADTKELPHYMNSRSSDYGAVISPDGNHVYFTSLRPAQFEKENIWKAERLNNNWGKPTLVEELSTEKNESIGSFSADGKTAYLSGNYDRGKIDGDIYISTVNIPKKGERAKWTKPVNLAVVNSSQVDVQPYVFDDKWMFFTSSRPGGTGGTDIYVSVFEKGAWQLPINLGPVINTPENEQTPFMDWDGKTLFFASNGHAGFGGYDMFKSVKIGSNWTDWSAPENLGLPLNSVKDDRFYYHHSSSNEAFISTDRSAEGFENILFADVVYAPAEFLIVDKTTGEKQTVFTPDTLVTQDNKSVIPPEPVNVKTYGTVKDETGNPMQVDIEFNYSISGKRFKETIKSDAQGIYELTLPYAPAYSVVVNKEGYFIFSQDIRPAKTGGEIKLSITLRPMLLQKVFVFSNIQFEFNSSYFTEATFAVVNEIALTLINNSKIKVEISGHTCNLGPADYNQWMSECRAQRVVEYLISKGVEPERMISKGYGLTKPIADNNKLSGRQKNRRVEVKVIE